MEQMTMTWGPKKFSKEWRSRNGILFSTSYREDRLGTMGLEIYDKSGNVRSRIEFDEQMLRDLKQDIEMALGYIKEQED